MRTYNKYFNPIHFNIDDKTFMLESISCTNRIDELPTYTITAIKVPASDFKEVSLFDIEKVIFNDPATIVMWADGTKTVVKCQDGDIYDERTGLLLCMAKKMYGNKNKFNDILNKWCPETKTVYMSDVIDYILGDAPKVVGQYIFGSKEEAKG